MAINPKNLIKALSGKNPKVVTSLKKRVAIAGVGITGVIILSKVGPDKKKKRKKKKGK